MIMLIMAHGTDENRVNENGWFGSPGASKSWDKAGVLGLRTDITINRAKV